jgi:hypothetical protein
MKKIKANVFLGEAAAATSSKRDSSGKAIARGLHHKHVR